MKHPSFPCLKFAGTAMVALLVLGACLLPLGNLVPGRLVLALPRAAGTLSLVDEWELDGTGPGGASIALVEAGGSDTLVVDGLAAGDWAFELRGYASNETGRHLACSASASARVEAAAQSAATMTLGLETFEVSFNTNGGSPFINPVSAVFGDALSPPGTVGKPGHDFLGWYADAACSREWNFTTGLMTGPQTLYAKWLAWQGLAGYYEFDGNANAAVGGIDGTIGGSPVPATNRTGLDGTSLSFDGVDDYVDIALPQNTFEADYSIDVWVKPARVSRDLIVSKNNSPGTNHYCTGEVWVGFDDTGNGNYRFTSYLGSSTAWAQTGVQAGTIVPQVGTWYHLVTVVQGSTMLLYVDGQLAASSTITNPRLVASSAPLRVAHQSVASFGYFSGAVDDLAMYNRALTATEVETRYLAGLVRHSAGATTGTSSIEGTEFEGEKAVDGSLSTRWASGGSGTGSPKVFDTPQWISLQLAGAQNIRAIELAFEAGSSNYQLEYSSDGSSWTPLGSSRDSPNGSTTRIFMASPVAAEHWRLTAYTTYGTGGVSLYEFGLFGD